MTRATQTPEGQVADAVSGNWVDRYAPEAARPYLRLSRADRPIGTWLLLLPCWWSLLLAMLYDATPAWSDLWIAIGCGAGAWLMRGAGCTWNDITDRRIDASVARTRSRPIPSGQVTVRGALIWMAAQALIAFGILLTFPPAAVILGVLSLGPVCIYPFAKRFTWWPQIFLGLAFNWGALLAWTAHTGSLSWQPVVLYVAGIAWTLFYDTIYAHQDKEDDALIGVKSTARLLGDQTILGAFCFYITAAAFFGAAVAANGAPRLGAVAVVGFLLHAIWQVYMVDRDEENALMVFKSNAWAALILLGGFTLAALS